MGEDPENFSSELVEVGVFGAPFGVRGWLKINSYTEPKSNIWNYSDWFFLSSENNQDYIKIKRLKESRDKFLVLLDNVLDRSAASNITNKKILVKKSNLPNLIEEQYYWVDLLKCTVYNVDHKLLGVVDYIFNNGANDVIVVKSNENKEILIPFCLKNFIEKVDLVGNSIIVKWDLDH